MVRLVILGVNNYISDMFEDVTTTFSVTNFLVSKAITVAPKMR